MPMDPFNPWNIEIFQYNNFKITLNAFFAFDFEWKPRLDKINILSFQTPKDYLEAPTYTKNEKIKQEKKIFIFGDAGLLVSLDALALEMNRNKFNLA